MTLPEEEYSVLEQLQRSENYWHWIKTTVVAFSCVITVLVVIIYSNHVLHQVKSNQATINCALHAFTPENYPNSSKIIAHCINK